MSVEAWGAARWRWRRAARRGLVAGLLLGLTACGGGGGGAPAAEPPLVAPGTWVILGSSSALGVGATGRQGWAQQLAAAPPADGVAVVNLAVGGTTTYAALPAGDTPPAGRPAPEPAGNIDAALARAPSLLLLAYPSNDAVQGLSADESLANLRRVRALARPRGVAVLVLGTQPRRLSDAALAQQVALDAGLARLAGECFVPLRDGLVGPDGRTAPALEAADGVHLNDAGHAVVRDRVLARLRSGRCVRLAS